MKLNLPDVTLVQIETMEHELARLAVEDCCRHADFAEVLIFTDQPDKFGDVGGDKTRFIIVPNWPRKKDWSWFSWFGVPPHVRTRQTLFIQWDSWIWDASMWRDEYLDYDIVGSPWWYTERNVGNLGFAIRSARLIRYLHAHQTEYPCVTDADDDLLCRTYRPRLEGCGFVWAPESVARDFAFECVRPSSTSRHFGFHAVFNFNIVLDEQRLMERARLMYRSLYIKHTSHLWGCFCQANPNIVSKLEAT